MNIHEQRIREFAYQIWESEGKPFGHTERHWEMASKLALADAESANQSQELQQIQQEEAQYAAQPPGTEPPPSVEPIHPISPTQPAQPVPPSDPIQPTDPVQPGQPVQPGAPVAQAEQISELLARPKKARTKSSPNDLNANAPGTTVTKKTARGKKSQSQENTLV